MFLILYPRQPVLLLFSGLLWFLFCFFDGPLGTAGFITQHVYLAFQCESTPFSVKVQQLQHLLRKLSPADIVAGEAKYTKSVFLHSVKCQGEIKHVVTPPEGCGANRSLCAHLRIA